MNVSFIAPYRSDNGRREQIWQWIQQRWAAFFPEVEIIVSDDCTHEAELNRGQAANLAAEKASGEVLIVGDADTTFAPGQLRKAIERVASTGDWMLSEHLYHLTEAYTNRLLISDPEVRLPRNPPNEWYGKGTTLSGGLVVMPTNVWLKFGGYDERWPGWGSSDKGLAASLDVLYRRRRYYPGTTYHLWHERTSGDSNWDLRIAYEKAGEQGDEATILRLRSEMFVR